MPGPAGRMVGGNPARRRREAVRVLGVDAAFDGVAADLHVLLAHAQLLARRDVDLFLHEVDPGDHLGHRVLDLDAGVHLDEVELAVLVKELERAGAAVADPAAGVDAALADPVTQLGR